MSQDDKEHNKVHRYLIRLFLHAQLDFFNDLNQKSDEKNILQLLFIFVAYNQFHSIHRKSKSSQC